MPPARRRLSTSFLEESVHGDQGCINSIHAVVEDLSWSFSSPSVLLRKNPRHGHLALPSLDDEAVATVMDNGIAPPHLPTTMFLQRRHKRTRLSYD